MTDTIDRVSKGTKRRTIRVDDELWLEAARIAAERDENLAADVLRPALVEYVKKNGSKA